MVTYVGHAATAKPEAILHLELEVLMEGVSKAWLRRLNEQNADRIHNKVSKDASKKVRLRKKMVQQGRK